MIEAEISELITAVGFPIFVCLWFMFRTEKIIKSNTEALTSIKSIIKTFKN